MWFSKNEGQRDSKDPFSTLSLDMYSPGGVPLQEGDSWTHNSLTIGPFNSVKRCGWSHQWLRTRQKHCENSWIWVSLFPFCIFSHTNYMWKRFFFPSIFTFINLEYSLFRWFFIPIISSWVCFLNSSTCKVVLMVGR